MREQLDFRRSGAGGLIHTCRGMSWQRANSAMEFPSLQAARERAVLWNAFLCSLQAESQHSRKLGKEEGAFSSLCLVFWLHGGYAYALKKALRMEGCPVLSLGVPPQ